MIERARDLVDSAVVKLSEYQSGKHRAIKTGVDHLDQIALGGLRPGDVITIGARPGVGKSYLLQQIESGMMNKRLNEQSENFVLLKCNYEMPVIKLLTRKLAYETKKSYKSILLSPPKPDEVEEYKRICDEERDDRKFYVNYPLNPQEFESAVSKFIEEHSDKDAVIISIDHIGLTKNSGSGGKKQAIDDTIEAINRMKMKYTNAIFLILSQLNREIEMRTDAKDSGPLLSDIMNADSIGQISDIVLILNMPMRYKMEKYMFLPGVYDANKVKKPNYTYNNLESVMVNPNTKFTNLRTTDDSGRNILYYHYMKIRDGFDSSEMSDIYFTYL